MIIKFKYQKKPRAHVIGQASIILSITYALASASDLPGLNTPPRILFRPRYFYGPQCPSILGIPSRLLLLDRGI